jgi:Flp pilus assembly protein TadB
MQQLLDLIVAVTIAMFLTAGLVAFAIYLWVRKQRRRARRAVERTLDRLAGQVTQRVAAGAAPGWALYRYGRLADDAGRAQTWTALQWLVLRERALEEARGTLVRAPERIGALRRSRRAHSMHR